MYYFLVDVMPKSLSLFCEAAGIYSNDKFKQEFLMKIHRISI